MEKSLPVKQKFNADYYRTCKIEELSDDELLKSDTYLHRSHWVSTLIKPDSILDLGCHTGIMSLMYAFRGWRVVGIDLSEKAIEFCNSFIDKYKITNSTYFTGLVEEYESEERFDNVLICELIEHVEDPNKLLDVAEKHLKKDGIIFISTPDYFGPYGISNDGDTSHEHLRVYKTDELKSLIENRGGKIIDFQDRQLIYLAYTYER